MSWTAWEGHAPMRCVLDNAFLQYCSYTDNKLVPRHCVKGEKSDCTPVRLEDKPMEVCRWQGEGSSALPEKGRLEFFGRADDYPENVLAKECLNVLHGKVDRGTCPLYAL